MSDGSFVCDTTNCFAKSNGGAGAGGHAARREPVRWLTFVDDNLLGCPNLYTQKLFDSLVQDPNWTHGREVEVVIVEVAGNRGYNWHTLQA